MDVGSLPKQAKTVWQEKEEGMVFKYEAFQSRYTPDHQGQQLHTVQNFWLEKSHLHSPNNVGGGLGFRVYWCNHGRLEDVLKQAWVRQPRVHVQNLSLNLCTKAISDQCRWLQRLMLARSTWQQSRHTLTSADGVLGRGWSNGASRESSNVIWGNDDSRVSSTTSSTVITRGFFSSKSGTGGGGANMWYTNV